MRVLLIIPILEALTFWMLLRLPKSKTETPNTRDIEVATIEVNCEPNECALPKIEIKLSGVQAKLQCLPSLVTFICPLVLVFIFEYICVSGLVSYSVPFFVSILKYRTRINFIRLFQVRNDLHSQHLARSSIPISLVSSGLSNRSFCVTYNGNILTATSNLVGTDLPIFERVLFHV